MGNAVWPGSGCEYKGFPVYARKGQQNERIYLPLTQDGGAVCSERRSGPDTAPGSAYRRTLHTSAWRSVTVGRTGTSRGSPA